jgi:2-C-methyl-D-erythritol 2,4-cyclodiphosphate synthase
VRRAVERLRESGWRPVAVDLSIATATPAIAPRRADLAASVAGLLGLPAEQVSVKGTTSDGLGFSGSEGLAAWAVASVERG